MDIDTAEIIKALRLIKEICSSYEQCEECCFSKGERQICNIMVTSPDHWEINSSWRAFK